MHAFLVALAGCRQAHVPTPTPTTSTGDTGGPACELGAEVTTELGPDGGEVRLCGATLTLPPGGLSAPTEVGLRLVNPPAPLPWERESAGGPVFALLPTGLSVPGTHLELPHTTGLGRAVELWHWDEENGWGIMELCELDEDSVGQTISWFQTYTVLRNSTVLPPSSTGLGTGTITQLAGPLPPFGWDVDDGYAFHDLSQDGSRAIWVEILAARAYLRATLQVTPQGAPSILEITTGDPTDPDGLWHYTAPFDGEELQTVTGAVDGDHLAATFDTTLFRGPKGAEASMPGSWAFDVTTERYQWPLEGGCE